ncbi:hypothetical protein [Aneurinibacillus terranovensis]|uniref:hypothetical protein n=1 Tax=Aneurinibacillus terranovensis TaxID=278991 RepID=UPI000413F52F|nr:hypothetical protein [Aneurinibacillus terranovensis]
MKGKIINLEWYRKQKARRLGRMIIASMLIYTCILLGIKIGVEYSTKQKAAQTELR